MFNSMLTEAGRDLRAMANDATYRAGTQIDNWIVTPGLANVMGRVHTMPGVCGKDHEIVAVEYYGADDPEGEREYRPRGVSRKLDRDAEEAFSKTVQEAYDTAMQTQQNVTPAERLKAMTKALTDHADTVIKEAQDKLRLRKEGNKFKGGPTDGTDEDTFRIKSRSVGSGTVRLLAARLAGRSGASRRSGSGATLLGCPPGLSLSLR